jgi:hypothetical protein
MVYGNIKDVFSSILGAWILYVELIKCISIFKKNWILSQLGCLHGTHSNGVGQGPTNDIEVDNLFMEKLELFLCWNL